ATDDTVVRGNTVTNNQVGLSLVTYTPSVLTNFDPQGSDGNNVNARVEANTLASWGDPSEVFYADIRGHKKGSIIFHQGAARVVGWNLLQDEEEPSIVSMSLDVIGDLDVTSAAI